ncbi:hypothetical protein Sjap_022803 [Stephania japonica]|uniref:Pseudouridine synthase RsuA/RluA-like domain-containing protein n=1 Tax=Stephania japonica TaxID=461633 RepID=A0AAP0HUR0_9MAGN
MAETIALFGRASLRSSKIRELGFKLHNSIFNEQFAHQYSTISTISREESENDNEKSPKKGKWFTLPPFSPTPNASSVAKMLSESRDVEKRIGEATPTSTTALKWVLHCCPKLPRSLVQKLFRLRQQIKPEHQEIVHAVRSTTFVRGAKPRRWERYYKELGYVGRYLLEKWLLRTSSTDSQFLFASNLCINDTVKVHRLDRDSSGTLVMARSQASATLLHSIFREKTFAASINENRNAKRILQRKYWALVIGAPRRAKGVISVPLGKVVLDGGKSERITVVSDANSISAQHAVTEYRVIETSSHGYSWLELCPLTGRKHQLRVHCAEYLGTPIVGDYKYGWQAHRNWIPVPSPLKFDMATKSGNPSMDPFGLNLESGSVAEKQPRLHLHCRQMVLPNVSMVLQKMQTPLDCDLSKLGSQDFVAPLPWHMQRSWDILSS